MADPWLPGAVITAVNLLIMFVTLRAAGRVERARVEAQVSAARGTGYTARAECAAGMHPGKANTMDVMLGGAGFVIMDEVGPFFGAPRSTTVTFDHPDPEVIGMMLGIEVTEVTPGVLRAGEFEVHLSEGGIPKTIRRWDQS
jgi:hypothetical protein